MRDGMEALVVTEESMAAAGLPNFGYPFAVSCENHGGDGYGLVQQWDATAKKWNLITEWIQSDQAVVNALVAEDSAAFAAENNIAERCN